MSGKPSTASQGAHVVLEPNALENGILILRSAMDYGFIAPIDISPEQFHPDLQSTARIVKDATDQGARGFSEVLMHLISSTDAGREQDLARAKLAEYGDGAFGISLDRLDRSAEIVRNYHLVKSRVLAGWKVQRILEAGNDPSEAIRELAEIEAGGNARRKSNLRERAYAMRFDSSVTPPPDELCMTIGDIPIAARGNLTIPQGKSKVGKSALISAIMGATQRGRLQATGDTLCISWTCESSGAIIHLDTEQSLADWHGLVCRSVTRSGLPEVSPRLVSLPLVMFSRSERLEILRQTLAYEHERGGVDLVMIDGVADLCVSPNDEAEALELVSKLHALAQEFHCAIFCVLHENPGTDQGKTRGHLGSELNRKAFANLRIDKDSETSISTIYGTDMRKRDIPKEHGFCFGWDDDAQMHTFQGRAAGLKAKKIEDKAIAEARNTWEPIFENIPLSGTKTPCPTLSPKQAAEIERDMDRTKDLTKEATMRKRMQRAESLGVLRKSSEGGWTLNLIGTSGT